MKNKLLSIVSVIFVLVVLAFLFYVANSKKEALVEFKCPEEYSSREEYIDRMGAWTAGYMKTHPEMSQEDILEERQKLFDERGCKGWTESNWNTASSSDKAQNISDAIKYAESQEPPRIRGDETAQEIYSNPYIKHIRTALNGYLDGSNTGAEEAVALDESKSDECGLDAFDKSYYRSKFLIFDAKDNDYGGVQTWIVFVDKPDTLFWAWVYKLGGDGSYSLRGFCKAGPPDDKKEKFVGEVKKLIESGEMTF